MLAMEKIVGRERKTDRPHRWEITIALNEYIRPKIAATIETFCFTLKIGFDVSFLHLSFRNLSDQIPDLWLFLFLLAAAAALYLNITNNKQCAAIHLCRRCIESAWMLFLVSGTTKFIHVHWSLSERAHLNWEREERKSIQSHNCVGLYFRPCRESIRLKALNICGVSVQHHSHTQTRLFKCDGFDIRAIHIDRQKE